MKKFIKFVVFIAFLCTFSQSMSAQMTRRDTLWVIMKDSQSAPNQRKKALDEIIGKGAFAPPSVEYQDPKDVLLRESSNWLDVVSQKE